MLKLRVFKGGREGDVYTLKEGENFIGRGPECDIVLDSKGVSKRHAVLIVQNGQCTLKDLSSANGTFVNGVKISSRILQSRDRIAFYDVFLEVLSDHSAVVPQTGWGTNLAYQTETAPASRSSPDPETLGGIVRAYVNKVILPGLYYLAEIYPVKSILASFLAGFVLLTTILASIPMAELTRDGVRKEAERRAKTIAYRLAAVAEKSLSSATESPIPVDFAENEDGVTAALVVAKEDGHIIAPVAKNSYSTDEFVARARKHDTEFVEMVNSSTIGVSIPIRIYSAEIGQPVTAAFAQVMYKIESFDPNATIGVFARVLVIGLLLGAILYFLLYRVLVHPIEDAIQQMDLVLRGNKDRINSKYDFDIFKKFLNDVNSAIARMGGPQSHGPIIDRSAEAANLVNLVGDAAFSLDSSGTFLQVNSAFETLVGMRQLTVQGQKTDILQDQALKLSIDDLLSRAASQPGAIVTNVLSIGGIDHDIDLISSPDHQGIAYSFGVIKKRSES